MAAEGPLGDRKTVSAASGIGATGVDPQEAGLERKTVFSHSGGGVPREAEAGAGSSAGERERGGEEGQEGAVTHVGEDSGFQLYEMTDGKQCHMKNQEDEQSCKLKTARELTHPSLSQVGDKVVKQLSTTMTKSAVPQELQPSEFNPLAPVDDHSGSKSSEAFQGMLVQVKSKDEEIRKLTTQLEKMRSDAGRMREHNVKASQQVLHLKDELKAARESSSYMSEHDHHTCVAGEHAFMEGNLEQTKTVNQELTIKLIALEQENEKLRLSEERARKEINSLNANYRKMTDENRTLSNQIQKMSQISNELANANLKVQRFREEIEALRKKNTELQSQVEVANLQASTFKEDFDTERKDREKAAVRYEEQREGLSNQVEELRDKLQTADKELERYKDLVESLEVVKTKSEASLQAAHEEVQVKSSQVKQYKKQVDSLKEQIEKRERQSTDLIHEMAKVRDELVKAKEQINKLEKTKDKKPKKSSTGKDSTPSPVLSPARMRSMSMSGTVPEERYCKLEADYDQALQEKLELQMELQNIKEAYEGLQGLIRKDQKQQAPPQPRDAVSPIPEEEPPPPRIGKRQQSPGPPSQPAIHAPQHQQPATHPQHLDVSHAQKHPSSHSHQRATPSHSQQPPSSWLPSQNRQEQNKAPSSAHQSQLPQQQAGGVGYYDKTEEYAAGSGAFVNQFQNQSGKGAHSASPYPGATSMPAAGQQHHQLPIRASTPGKISSEPQRAVLPTVNPQLGGLSGPVGEPLHAGMAYSNAPPREQQQISPPQEDFSSQVSSTPPDVNTFPEPVVSFDPTFDQQPGHAHPQSDYQARCQFQPSGSVGRGYSYPQDQYQHRQNMGLPLDHNEPGRMNVGRLSPSQSPVSPQYSSHGSSLAPPQPLPRSQIPGQSQSYPEHASNYAQRKSESQPTPQSSGHYQTQASVPTSQAQHPQQVQDESALIKGIDSDISLEAEHVAEMLSDGSRQRPTQQHVPYDRNLVCPHCNKMFRVGEIQKFRSHVRECESSYV